jgi:hypothetical protein
MTLAPQDGSVCFLASSGFFAVSNTLHLSGDRSQLSPPATSPVETSLLKSTQVDVRGSDHLQETIELQTR